MMIDGVDMMKVAVEEDIGSYNSACDAARLYRALGLKTSVYSNGNNLWSGRRRGFNVYVWVPRGTRC